MLREYKLGPVLTVEDFHTRTFICRWWVGETISTKGPEVNRMNSDISAGPDSVHTVILKQLRYEIAWVVTVECNLLLMSDWYQRNRGWQMQYHFLRGLQRSAGQLRMWKFHFHIGKKSHKTTTNDRKANRIQRHISGEKISKVLQREILLLVSIPTLKEPVNTSMKVSWWIHLDNPKLSWNRKGCSPFKGWNRKKAASNSEIA